MVIKKIAVLLAAYNGEEYLYEQINSILEQKSVNLTIYISLDRSVDRSLTILQHFEGANANVKLLDYGDRFGSAGKNFFHLVNTVNIDEYDYVAFADQDDIWYPSKLFEAIDQLKKTDCDGYSSNVIAFWDNGREELIKKSFPQVEYDYLFESPGPGCTFVFTKKLYKSIQNNVRLNYSEIRNLWMHDWFCYSFSRFNGAKWVIDSRPLMKYRQHSNNEVGANSGFTSFFKRVKTMFDGSGLDYVEQQANFIGQQQCLPIVYLSQGRLGFLKLALISYKLRRKPSHKLFCAIYFILLILNGRSSAQTHLGRQQ